MIAQVAEVRREDKADALLFAAMGASSPYSQEVAEHVQELIGVLRGKADDSSTAHLLNPDAQTDWEALRGASADPKQTVLGIRRESKEEHDGGRPAAAG